MMGIYTAMFSVAVPTIRDEFMIQADMAAWVVAVYSLPFMMFMPLHGRLGDAYGKRRVLLAGTAIFMLGTLIAGLANNLGWLMAGRAIQGVGSAGFTPLALAIIAQIFPVEERGKLMGTWNICYPIGGLLGPVIGGILIDSVGWRVIFWPTLILGLVAYFVTRRQVPALPGFADKNFLRRFDWIGVILLSLGATSLLFYVSSRPVTGVPALQDWRLLGSTILWTALLVLWERYRAQPFIPIEIFGQLQFSLASSLAGIRMFIMNALRFLVALYVVDIHGLDATATGLVITSHAIPLFLMLRLGGQLADRWGSRWPVAISMAVQAASVAYLAFLPDDVSIWLVVAGVLGQSIGASISLAPLHRAAMADIPDEQTGVAAGLYSMIRFAGAILGTALSGVLLQMALTDNAAVVAAYQQVFWFVAGVALLGLLLGMLLDSGK